MNKAVFSGTFSLLLALTAVPVWAGITINVGNHVILANTAGQQILINASGGDAVNGMNFYVQVANGGPEASGFLPPGELPVDGPEISGLDIISGTIFALNNNGQVGLPSLPQFRNASVTTPEGISVPANGRIATVTLNTAGFTTLGAQWPLVLTNALNTISTDFTRTVAPTDPPGASVVTPTVTNGTITLVESRVSAANGSWATNGTWTPAGPPAPGQFSMVQVGNHKVSVGADASAYSLLTNNSGGEVSVAPGKTLTIGTDAAVAAGKLIAQISGASAGKLVVGGELDLSSPIDILGLDWVPAGAGSKFGGAYEIAQYGSLDGIFSASNGGNIGSAYVSAIDYLTGSKIAVTLYPLLTGDTNIDGDVDSDDYVKLKLNFGKTLGATWWDGDTNLDGDVDSDDYVALKLTFGSTVPSTKGAKFSPVPEPGTVVLLLIGAVCMFWRFGNERKGLLAERK